MERKLYSLREGLKRARKERGLTQNELAEELNVHPKTVMNWEQGIATPSLENIMQLSDALECDMDYLTGKLEQPTHNIQFIHDQTGLTGEAVAKLQENRDLMFVLSLLIEQPGFVSWLVQINNYLSAIHTRKLFPPKDEEEKEDDDFHMEEKQFLTYKRLINILESIPVKEYEERLYNQMR